MSAKVHLSAKGLGKSGAEMKFASVATVAIQLATEACSVQKLLAVGRLFARAAEDSKLGRPYRGATLMHS